MVLILPICPGSLLFLFIGGKWYSCHWEIRMVLILGYLPGFLLPCE